MSFKEGASAPLLLSQDDAGGAIAESVRRSVKSSF